ncbi:MAG: response regulator [Deltaproteobacteria bacterium]|nr:MAG: response regulator [Deltaproteobacteria bacterium]
MPDTASIPHTTPADSESAELLARFHEELRLRNVSAFLWSTTIFDLAYLGWALFDRLLAPDHWPAFLGIRLAVVAFGTVLALLIARSRNQRYTWEAFWTWLFACGAGIAAMLPWTGDHLLQYLVGFSLILYGAGLLPFWRPRWAITNVVAILATAPLAWMLRPGGASAEDLLTGVFFLLTGAGASVVMATFKYRLARRDFFTREQLARTSKELQHALDRLQAHDQLKSRFFANISHELRTPLTLILGPVQAMLDRDPQTWASNDLRIVVENAERLLRLIDDLLELSKLDAGGLRLRLSTFDLGQLVASTVARFGPAAATGGLTLQSRIEEDLPDVLGDPHRIEMVVTNLVGNAIKYTPPGGSVSVGVHRLDDRLRVTVTDTGPGIPADELSMVFNRFFQAGRGRRGAGGVGIGLALARELVDLHSGTISVDSVEGEGSTFSFELLLGRDHIRPEVIDRRRDIAERRVEHRAGRNYGRRATDLPPPVPASPLHPVDSGEIAFPTSPPVRLEQGRRARILVVEDQPDMQAFLADLLGAEFEVTTCGDGDEAWRLLPALKPDLVLTDDQMPGRSGTSLCQAIKSDAALSTTPVVLLTARAGTEGTLRAYAAGADDFVAKPFHPRILLARVRAQLHLRALSAELARKERLATVGTLAAGILHEIRNPVNALMSATRTLGSPNLPHASRARLLDVLADATQRIHRITATLDAHVRPADDGGPAVCDLAACIASTLQLLDHRLGEVEVRVLGEGPLQARIQPGPINQVFVNLIDNALRAGATHIDIALHDVGDTVKVEVTDDGSGIPEAVLNRIFEPFFTTAAPGKGSGLGLYLSKTIIEQAGGTIAAERLQPHGTCFRIVLPAPAAAQGT